MGVTEIALLPLKEGKTPDDPTSAAGKVHTEALNTLLAQPGVQRVYWGRQVEDPLLLRWFVDWDDIKDHENFMNSEYDSPSYRPCPMANLLAVPTNHSSTNSAAPSVGRQNSTMLDLRLTLPPLS